MDLGSAGNYMDARELAAQGLKIEAEDQAEELKMVDGTWVRIKGRV